MKNLRTILGLMSILWSINANAVSCEDVSGLMPGHAGRPIQMQSEAVITANLFGLTPAPGGRSLIRVRIIPIERSGLWVEGKGGLSGLRTIVDLIEPKPVNGIYNQIEAISVAEAEGLKSNLNLSDLRIKITGKMTTDLAKPVWISIQCRGS